MHLKAGTVTPKSNYSQIRPFAEAFVIKEHDKSMALLERLGFEKKELRTANEINDGVLVDQYRFLFEKGEVLC